MTTARLALVGVVGLVVGLAGCAQGQVSTEDPFDCPSIHDNAGDPNRVDTVVPASGPAGTTVTIEGRWLRGAADVIDQVGVEGFGLAELELRASCVWSFNDDHEVCADATYNGPAAGDVEPNANDPADARKHQVLCTVPPRQPSGAYAGLDAIPLVGETVRVEVAIWSNLSTSTWRLSADPACQTGQEWRGYFEYTTAAPTAVPTAAPTTSSPTAAPVTASPTAAPTALPTAAPTTSSPTAPPVTASPTASPTAVTPRLCIAFSQLAAVFAAGVDPYDTTVVSTVDDCETRCGGDHACQFYSPRLNTDNQMVCKMFGYDITAAQLVRVLNAEAPYLIFRCVPPDETYSPTTSAPTLAPTPSPTSEPPSFLPTPTLPPTLAMTVSPTTPPTPAPTTSAPTTSAPTTSTPTTPAPTTSAPTTSAPVPSLPTTAQSTVSPTVSPTLAPTMSPTTPPTPAPTTSAPVTFQSAAQPTISPSMPPTLAPTVSPTTPPTPAPTTSAPTTSAPVTSLPTTTQSTVSPTVSPTLAPTMSPTTSPTPAPTVSPTTPPTPAPTTSAPVTSLPTAISPTTAPTASPSAVPTTPSDGARVVSEAASSSVLWVAVLLLVVVAIVAAVVVSRRLRKRREDDLGARAIERQSGGVPIPGMQDSSLPAVPAPHVVLNRTLSPFGGQYAAPSAAGGWLDHGNQTTNAAFRSRGGLTQGYEEPTPRPLSVVRPLSLVPSEASEAGLAEPSMALPAVPSKGIRRNNNNHGKSMKDLGLPPPAFQRPPSFEDVGNDEHVYMAIDTTDVISVPPTRHDPEGPTPMPDYAAVDEVDCDALPDYAAPADGYAVPLEIVTSSVTSPSPSPCLDDPDYVELPGGPSDVYAVPDCQDTLAGTDGSNAYLAPETKNPDYTYASSVGVGAAPGLAAAPPEYMVPSTHNPDYVPTAVADAEYADVDYAEVPGCETGAPGAGPGPHTTEATEAPLQQSQHHGAAVGTGAHLGPGFTGHLGPHHHLANHLADHTYEYCEPRLLLEQASGSAVGGGDENI